MNRGRILQPEKPGGLDDTIGRSLNRQGPRLTGDRHRAVKLPIELVVGAAKLPVDSGDVGDAIREIHTPKVYQKMVQATQKVHTQSKKIYPKIGGMTKKWIQLPAFQAHVKSYQDLTNETHEQIAKKLGITASYLRNVLYNSKTPGIKFKTKAANLFKTDLSLYLDNPKSKRPTSKDISSFSEISRHQFDRLVVALGDEKLDQEDLDTLFEEFQREIQKTLNMKNRKK